MAPPAGRCLHLRRVGGAEGGLRVAVGGIVDDDEVDVEGCDLVGLDIGQLIGPGIDFCATAGRCRRRGGGRRSRRRRRRRCSGAFRWWRGDRRRCGLLCRRAAPLPRASSHRPSRSASGGWPSARRGPCPPSRCRIPHRHRPRRSPGCAATSSPSSPFSTISRSVMPSASSMSGPTMPSAFCPLASARL